MVVCVNAGAEIYKLLDNIQIIAVSRETIRGTTPLVGNIQGAIQKIEYVSNCALSSGAICLKILPFDCLSLCHVVLHLDIWM